jgi:hypothetical protein
MEDRIMDGYGITQRQYAVLMAKAFENLPTDTDITVDDIDAILCWVLPDYRDMLAKAAGATRLTP